MNRRKRDLLSTLVEEGTVQDVQTELAYAPVRPMRRRSAKSSTYVVLATGVLSWHLMLFFALSPADMEASNAGPTPTRMKILPLFNQTDPADVLVQEARAIWSPVLLSLPSKLGFSGGVQKQDKAAMPTFEPVRRQPLFAQEEIRIAPMAPKNNSALDQQIAERFSKFAIPPSMTESYHPILPPADATIFVVPMYGFPVDGLVRSDWSATVTQLDSRPWNLVAALTIGDQGDVTGVLLLKSSGDSTLDTVLIREMRQWSVAEGRNERRILLRLLSYGNRPDLARSEESS